MTFDLFTIGVLLAAAVVYQFLPVNWRGWSLMIGSIVVVYWLQPALPLRNADFILPTVTVVLAVGGWYLTRKPDDEAQQATLPQDRVTFAVITALLVGMAFFRYIDTDFRLTPAPPNPLWVAVGLGIVYVPVLALRRPIYARQWGTLAAAMIFIIALFVVLKANPLVMGVSSVGRALTGQDRTLAGAIDLNWLGFSYVAFRLIHTLRDRQTEQLPALSLQQYMTYIVFFPAFIAGPIDRAERFQEDMVALPAVKRFDGERFLRAFERISMGLFKKFVIADLLAVGLSLNPTNAALLENTFWAWVLLYGYALRLFFDFAGYTDIAIGIGILFGVQLPENFKAPYLKRDITTFWQSWHITLSNWARFYVFSPLSRNLLRRKPRPNPMLIVLATQTATMVTIGLWHGITWNFLIWGLWHGVALFVHKQYTDRTRKWYRSLKEKPWQYRAVEGVAWFITFHYVVLGWVWFAMPDLVQALNVYAALFGFAR
ncbi:MAG: MBOAT family O-acyltransferase [Chloroflexota bacterium]